MKYTLKGWLVDNAVTVDNKDILSFFLHGFCSTAFFSVLNEYK